VIKDDFDRFTWNKGEDVASFFLRFTKIINALRAAGFPVEDHNQTHKLLQALPSTLITTSQQIRGRPNMTPTLAMDIIRDCATDYQEILSKEGALKSQESLLTTSDPNRDRKNWKRKRERYGDQNGNRQRDGRGNRRDGWNGSDTCSYCRRGKHRRDDCNFKKRDEDNGLFLPYMNHPKRAEIEPKLRQLMAKRISEKATYCKQKNGYINITGEFQTSDDENAQTSSDEDDNDGWAADEIGHIHMVVEATTTHEDDIATYPIVQSILALKYGTKKTGRDEDFLYPRLGSDC